LNHKHYQFRENTQKRQRYREKISWCWCQCRFRNNKRRIELCNVLMCNYFTFQTSFKF